MAPNTSTLSFVLPTPYIYTKNSVFTLLEDSFSPSDLEPHIESISSIKMILGAFSLANLNSYFMCFSDSPTYFDIKSELDILKNVELHSVAHALAIKVFPVPGGPYNRIPFQGSTLPVKKSGIYIGNIKASYKDFLASTKPATSSHLTLGFSPIIAYSILSLSLSSSPLLHLLGFPPPPYTIAFLGNFLMFFCIFSNFFLDY